MKQISEAMSLELNSLLWTFARGDSGGAADSGPAESSEEMASLIEVFCARSRSFLSFVRRAVSATDSWSRFFAIPMSKRSAKINERAGPSRLPVEPQVSRVLLIGIYS